MQTRLNAMDPANVLKRGFAILMKDDKTVADSVDKLASGETVKGILSDGSVTLTVE